MPIGNDPLSPTYGQQQTTPQATPTAQANNSSTGYSPAQYANNTITPALSGNGNGAPVGGGGQSVASPISWQQQYNAFQMPDLQNQQNAIQGAYNLQNHPNYANSPLAGLTTLGQVANAGAATAAPTTINTAASNPITAAQLQNVNQLYNTATGNGPSVAEAEAQAQREQNVANTMAVIGSQRGSSDPALGLRTAQDQMAGANQNAAWNAVAGKTQEEMNAQNQLTNALGTTQGQVMQGAQAQAQLNASTVNNNVQALNAINAQNVTQQNQASIQQGQLQQQTNLANLSAQQQTQGMNTSEYNAALQAQMALANNQFAANQNYANMVTNENTQLQGIQANIGINNSNNMMGLIGAGIAGGSALGAGALAASDRALKTAIKAGSRSVKDFLSKMPATPTNGFNLMGAL